MPKDLTIISVVNGLLRFAWETVIYLDNAREMGHSGKVRMLVYSSKGHSPHPYFKRIERLFPEVSFYYYEDVNEFVAHDVARTDYIPLLRPYCLARHFREHPELKDHAILYTDADILFTKPLDFLTQYKDDDINYLSYSGERIPGGNYLGMEYLESKVKDVIPEKVREYVEADPITHLLHPFGLTKEDLRLQADNVGGAQYLLKGVDSSFWKDVYDSAAYIKLYLTLVNKKFFVSEDKGIQSWCADMWAVLFILWKRGGKTSCPKDMDFCWASDRKDKLKEVNIFHNAGITSDSSLRDNQRDESGKKIEVVAPAFYKGANSYKGTTHTPFDDIKYLKEVVNNPTSQKFCTSYYAQKIIDVKHKYNL